MAKPRYVYRGGMWVRVEPKPQPKPRPQPKLRPATPIVTEHQQGRIHPNSRRPSNYWRGAAPGGGPGRAQVEGTAKLVGRKNLTYARVQRQLGRAGFDVAVDGVWGAQSQKAWKSYTASLGRASAYDAYRPRGATPIVTEHTYGQAGPRSDIDKYRPTYPTHMTAEQKLYAIRHRTQIQAAATKRAGKEWTLERNPVSDAALGAGALIRTNVLAYGTPKVRGTQSRYNPTPKEASALNINVAKTIGKQLYTEGRHPLRDPAMTAIDLATVASLGIGGAGRVAAASRAVTAAERGSRIPSALGALARRPTAADILPRRLIGHPETGTRNLRFGNLNVQPTTQSRSVATEAGQHIFDRLSEKFPHAKGFGADSRARRLVAEELQTKRMRAMSGLAPLGESIRQISSKIPGKFTGQDMAYSLIARYGHTGSKGVELLEKDLAEKRAALQVAEAAGEKKRVSRLEKRIKLLEAARPHVENPGAALQTALAEGRKVSGRFTASRVTRGALKPGTADEAVARHYRALHGAVNVEDTPSRLGLDTPSLVGHRARTLNIQKAYDRAVEQVQRLEFSGAQRKQLGLKSEALVARQEKLKEGLKALKAELEAVPKGSTEELGARLDELHTQWERFVDAVAGHTKGRTGTQAEQMFENSLVRKGQTPRNVAQSYRHQAEQRAFAVMRKNAHLPLIQKVQGKIDEAAALGAELSAREARAGGILADKPPKGMLHPYLPTTDAALREQIRRDAIEHAALSGRVEKLPVGMPNVHALRDRISVGEKEMRRLEAEWNAPAADVLEERAQLHRAMRAGTGAQKELAGAKGGHAGEQGLELTGVEELQSRIDTLNEHIKERRGPAPEELVDLRKKVNKMRRELTKATKARAHIVPGELPYAVTHKGEIVLPIGHAKAHRLGSALGVQKEKQAAAEARAASAVTPTGLVSPPEMTAAREAQIKDLVEKGQGTEEEIRAQLSASDPLPHEMRPGEQAFFTEDMANIPKMAALARGKVRSLNPPRNEVNKWRGTLAAEGREVIGPRGTYRTAVKEIRHEGRTAVAKFADDVSVPFNEDIYDPKRHSLYDPNAAIPGRELPYGTKSAIAAAKRAAEEMPIEHADELLDPQAMLKRYAEDHEAWWGRAFPKGPVPEHTTGLKMIDRKWETALAGTDSYVPGWAGKSLDFWNQINRSALIYLNSSYIPVQGTGNLLYLGLQQGFTTPTNILKYARLYKKIDPADRRQLTLEVGGGAAQALAHEGVGAGPLTKLADFQNYGADKFPRDFAWLHEANEMGYTTPEKIHELLNNPKLDRHLNVVSDRAQQAMVKFKRRPTAFRRGIGRAIFIAPWLEGSTRWLARTLADRPLTAAVAYHIRDHIIDKQKAILKGGKKVTGGFIPTAIPGKLASKASFGLFPEPQTDRGGLSVIPGINPDAISPTGSGVGVIKGVAELLPGGQRFAPTHGGTRLAGAAQPSLVSLAGAALGLDPYSGYKYDASTKLLGSGFLGRLKEQAVGTSEHPAFPLGQMIATGLAKPKDLSQTDAAKMPLYYPEHGWAAVGRRALMGSLRPREVIKPASIAKGAKAEADLARGNPEAMLRIHSKKAIEKQRIDRNKLLDAAKQYAPERLENGNLPAALRQAYRLRTLRDLNYVQHGITSDMTGAPGQAAKLRADVALLVRRKLIDQSQAAFELSWLAAHATDHEALETERKGLGTRFFGGEMISAAHKEVRNRKKAATDFG